MILVAMTMASLLDEIAERPADRFLSSLSDTYGPDGIRLALISPEERDLFVAAVRAAIPFLPDDWRGEWELTPREAALRVALAPLTRERGESDG